MFVSSMMRRSSADRRGEKDRGECAGTSGFRAPGSLLLLLLGIGSLPSAVSAEPATFVIDPEHVTVAFLVEHLGYARVLGSFGEVEGSYVFDEETGTLSNVDVRVATASVSSHHEERDEHLRSRDFLASDRFPRMRFSAASAERIGDGRFAVTGELELLGESRPLRLEATLNKSGEYPIGRNAYAMGVSARGKLRRSEFGMTYGVDNGWVGDDVEIIVEFEARRQ